MRPDLRSRLREITKTFSTPKMGVTGVTATKGSVGHTLSHLTVTPLASEKTQQKQRVTPVTPVTPSKTEGQVLRHTFVGVTTEVTDGVTAPRADLEDWLACFDERAGIREFDGGYARDEAERLALDDTIALIGPKPALH